MAVTETQRNAPPGVKKKQSVEGEEEETTRKNVPEDATASGRHSLGREVEHFLLDCIHTSFCDRRASSGLKNCGCVLSFVAAVLRPSSEGGWGSGTPRTNRNGRNRYRKPVLKDTQRDEMGAGGWGGVGGKREIPCTGGRPWEKNALAGASRKSLAIFVLRWGVSESGNKKAELQQWHMSQRHAEECLVDLVSPNAKGAPVSGGTDTSLSWQAKGGGGVGFCFVGETGRSRAVGIGVGVIGNMVDTATHTEEGFNGLDGKGNAGSDRVGQQRGDHDGGSGHPLESAKRKHQSWERRVSLWVGGECDKTDKQHRIGTESGCRENGRERQLACGSILCPRS